VRNGLGQDVAVENEVLIDGIPFPTTGPIRVANISVVPNPIVLGDTSSQSETQVVSQFIQPDASSGIGVNRANARIEFDRAWTSEAETRWSRQITLPALITDLDRPAGETGAPFWIGTFLGETRVVFGRKIYSLVGTTWTLLRTLSDDPTGVAVHGDRFWVITPSAMEWQENGSPVGGIGTTPWSWQIVPENYGALCFSTQDNFYRWAYYGGAATTYMIPFWSLRAYLYPYAPDKDTAGSPSTPSPWSTVSFTGQPIDIHTVLSAATDAGRINYYVGVDGVYHQGGTQGLIKGRVQYQALTPGNYGRTACIFGVDIIVPTGELGLFAARIGTLEPRPIGLDQEDGVPGSKWGVINQLVAGTKYLYALVTQRGINDTDPHDLGVYAWNGHWHPVASSASGLMVTTGVQVQGKVLALLPDGLYVGYTKADGNPNIKRIDELPRSVSPKQIGVSPTQTRFRFAAGPVQHVSPWYDFGSSIQTKLLLKLQVLAEATPTETITIEYATDLDETTWTPMGTIAANGLHALAFKGPLGVRARLVRFRYTLTREAGLANAYKRPLLDFAICEYMRTLPATYGFAIELDLTRSYKGRTAVDLLDAIKRLSDPAQTAELVPFTYQDDQHQEPQTHYVRISRMTGQEFSGRRQRGIASYMVSMMAPYAQDSV
jgi:hypothetical protein